MRFHVFGFSVVAVLIASMANAHVRIQPVESQLGARETYTVRVPSEGNIATTWIELEVPAGMLVTSVEGQAETKKIGERIVSIVWRMEIPPGQSHEFSFTAINPSVGRDLAWKAHQHFADESSADWVEAPGGRRPASVTTLKGER